MLMAAVFLRRRSIDLVQLGHDLLKLPLAKPRERIQRLGIANILHKEVDAGLGPQAALATATTNFLNIVGQIARRCIVVHGIDVIDIDAHAKRLGAHEHPAAARRKRVLNDLLVRGIFAAVIAQDFRIRNAALIDDRIDMTLIWAIDNGMAVVAHGLINPLLSEVGFYLLDGTGQLAFASPDNVEGDVVTTRVAQERLAVAKLQVGNRMRNDIIAP